MPGGVTHNIISSRVGNVATLLILLTRQYHLLYWSIGFYWGTYSLSLDNGVKSSPFQEYQWPLTPLFNWWAGATNHISFGKPLVGQNTKRGLDHNLIIAPIMLLGMWIIPFVTLDLITAWILHQIDYAIFEMQHLNFLWSQEALILYAGVWSGHFIHLITDMLHKSGSNIYAKENKKRKKSK